MKVYGQIATASLMGTQNSNNKINSERTLNNRSRECNQTLQNWAYTIFTDGANDQLPTYAAGSHASHIKLS
jgi:hypothetical protein